MRFADLSRETTQSFWKQWKYMVRETLYEFNTDVLCRRGFIRENSYWERDYLLLETTKECLYVFPLPGNILVFSLYQGKLSKECLTIKSTANKPDPDQLIGWVGADIGVIEERYEDVKDTFQYYMEKILRLVYRRYWIKLLF